MVVGALNRIVGGNFTFKILLQIAIIGGGVEGGADTQERNRLVDDTQLGIYADS